MNSAVVAPPESESEPQANVAQEIAEALPSWLVSLVVHLTIVLLMALVVVGEGGFGTGEISLNVAGGPGGEGEDDMLAAAVEVPSELPQVDDPAPPADMTELLQDPALPADIALVNPPGLPDGLAGAIGNASPGASAGGGDDPSGAGSPAQTAVFGLAAEGETFVYVFDRSESMTSTLSFTSEGTVVFSITPLEAAKTELLRSLGDLDRGQRFHIIFYNHQVWMFDTGRDPRKPIAATAQNKRRAQLFIESVFGEGGTRHVKPLEEAIKMKPDVIFLLTDGEDKDDPSDAEIERLTRQNDGRTKINVIQFVHTPRTRSKLIQLAAENGGRHTFYNIANLGPKVADTEAAAK